MHNNTTPLQQCRSPRLSSAGRCFCHRPLNETVLHSWPLSATPLLSCPRSDDTLRLPRGQACYWKSREGERDFGLCGSTVSVSLGMWIASTNVLSKGQAARPLQSLQLRRLSRNCATESWENFKQGVLRQAAHMTSLTREESLLLWANAGEAECQDHWCYKGHFMLSLGRCGEFCGHGRHPPSDLEVVPFVCDRGETPFVYALVLIFSKLKAVPHSVLVDLVDTLQVLC